MDAAPNPGNQKDDLKNLLQQAAQEYNVLHAENDKANVKCALLAQERDAAMQELVKLQQVSHLVLEEVNAMQTQLEVQKSCRERAESFATTLNKENKKLKRMSMAIMAKVGIHEFPADLLDDVAVDAAESSAAPAASPSVPAAVAEAPASTEVILLQYQTEVKALNSRVTELVEERSQLVEQLEAAQKEKAELGEVIFQQAQTFTNYNQVSVLALEEFAEVQKQLELEKELRQKAEEYAHKMLVEQKKLQRQSQVLLQSHAAERQLMEALDDNAALTTQLEDERHQHQLQVKELQDKLESLELRKELESLQRRLELAEQDMQEKDARTERAEAAARDLKHEVEELQKRLKKATEPPIPPPPPPPPALPPVNPLRTLMALLKKKDGGLPTKGRKPSSADSNGELEDVRKKAVDEMMERIRRGVPLKPVGGGGGTLLRVKVPPKDKPDTPDSAIVELKGILNVMKKSATVDKARSTTALSEAGETELERILRRRKQSVDDQLLDEGGNGNMKYSQSLPSVVKKPSGEEKK